MNTYVTKAKVTKVRLLVLGIAAMLVVACGQKGPLFLPEPTQKQVEQYESEKNKRDEKEQKQDKNN